MGWKKSVIGGMPSVLETSNTLRKDMMYREIFGTLNHERQTNEAS